MVEYLPGPRNAAADYLSRLESKVMVGGVLWKEIRMESGDDEDLNKVRKAIESKDWTNFRLDDEAEQKVFYSQRKKFKFQDGVLLWERRIVPPRSARRNILMLAHQGHPGIVRMKSGVRAEYWWPGMDRMVETLIGECEPCQRSGKTKSPTTQAKIQILHPQKPGGEQWALDITGPFANGFYLVVLIDYQSKWPEVL